MGPSAEKLNPAERRATEAAHISAINMGFASMGPSFQSELLMKERENSARQLSFPELAIDNEKLQRQLKLAHENYSDGDEDDEEEEEEKIGFYMPYPEDSIAGYGVDQRDERTSDSWIKRHPELVRLTGRHPFNCEAPLSKLMQHGFLHLCTMCEIMAMCPRQCLTHSMLGPWRFLAWFALEEQNTVQQTIGFNWGAAGVSTSFWKGARLADVLKRCGVYSKKRGALYVCFEGEETLPGGGGSRYGTSISVDVALDESCDVLVAYMQNGKLLEPDHGFPIRIIIPGYIGGRMVKWLRRITVTSEESDNYYHYNDNRVLPSHVDAEKANSEGWWFKPEYIINELNINSAICTPAHGEVVPINGQTLQVPYTVQGYAYSGVGRKVIRVEVSLDGGESWLLCRIYHPENPTKYGKYWCWCFWELDINVMQLLQAKELVVRAWDASMNTQPQKLTWNVMGMMNNCWFTVRINPCKPKGGGIALAFEHPTQPGNLSGGWMVPRSAPTSEQQEKTTMLAKSFYSPMLNRSIRQITNAELKRHNTRESPWIVVHNIVYDCTKFLKDHPGGSDSILINAGTDCTEEFDAIHSVKAKAMLEDFKIGELASFGTFSAESTPETPCMVVIELLQL
ncbi:hypothetical protein L7F22_052491 [Adiantum nelumboides]|nr:hypothetical protein [Adiantum nelumboides]